MRPGCSGRHGDGVPPSAAARVLYSCSGDGSSRPQQGQRRGYTMVAVQGSPPRYVFQSAPGMRPSRFTRRKPQDPVTRRDESVAFDEAWRPPEWFERVFVVLVEPTDPVNIGGVIRAMANCGFLKLRLVRPVGFDPWHIVGIAHYTQHVIEATETYESLPEAVARSQLVVGLTGRHHRVERNALPFQ